MIPALDQHGLLPVGIHDCTLAEAEARFGRFQESEHRPRLWADFTAFLREVKMSGIVESVWLDGSFVTSKSAPNDVDLILVVSASHDFSADLTPAEYNVLSKRRVFRRFGFDMLVAGAGSERLIRYVNFFQQVRFEPDRRKGILRIVV